MIDSQPPKNGVVRECAPLGSRSRQPNDRAIKASISGYHLSDKGNCRRACPLLDQHSRHAGPLA